MEKTIKKIEDQYQSQIQKLSNQIEKTRAKKKEVERKRSNEKRKARTRHLIEIGGLAQIADIDLMDKGTILGIMIQGRKLIEDESTLTNLKRLGDSVLQQRSQRR